MFWTLRGSVSTGNKCSYSGGHAQQAQWGGRAACCCSARRWSLGPGADGCRMDGDVLVVKGAGRGGRCILARLLALGGDNGLQVLALSALLAAVAVRCLRDLLRLVDGRLLDVGAIHRVASSSPPRAGLAAGRASRGCGLRVAVCGMRYAVRRSGRVLLGTSAGGYRICVLGGAAAHGRRCTRCDFFNRWMLGLALSSGLSRCAV